MGERVAVVIVNWNGFEHLRTCIPLVLAQDYSNFRVVVVDNGSTDGSVPWLRSEFPEVQVICNDRNRGFAKPTNQGIQASEGPYVALLNNDTRPESGWLTAMMEAIGKSEKVGMVASQIRFASCPHLIDSAGIEVDVLGIAWNRRLGHSVETEPIEAVEVFGPCAAAALYSKRMLDEIGLFDERYFAYYEDVELAWRARRAGWRCLYVPSAKVLHVHSATGRRISALKTYYLNRNRVWTLIKHYPIRRFLIWWPLILLFDTFSWVWPLFFGHNDALRGHIDAFRGWRELWRERRQLAHAGYDVSLSLPRSRRGRMLEDTTR